MSATVRPVLTKKDLTQFLRAPYYIYRDDPHYRAPLEIERRDALNPKKNPYFEHATVQLFVAERDGKIVGRISAQIDDLAQEKWGPNLAHFGFFDADDELVADVLLKSAEAWATVQGAKRIQGPWSLSANMEAGLLVDGFDTPPVIFMPHGKPEYQTWLESRGYAKAKDMWAYWLDVPNGLPEKALRIVAAAEKSSRMTLREVTTGASYDKDIKDILEIFNDAWSDNWGYVPFTKAEGANMAKELKQVIKPYRTVIAEIDGEVAGFMVVIPDLNHMAHGMNGKLFPTGIFKLLPRILKDDIERVRVPLMGVKKKFQGGRTGGMAALWMIEYCRRNVEARGCKFGELSWILEDNQSMNGILEQIGCVRYKTFRVFEKPIG